MGGRCKVEHGGDQIREAPGVRVACFATLFSLVAAESRREMGEVRLY